MVDGPLLGVIYYRSNENGDDEATQITIGQQKPLGRASVRFFNVDTVREPIKDRAISGETVDRPGLEKIEEPAEAGEITFRRRWRWIG